MRRQTVPLDRLLRDLYIVLAVGFVALRVAQVEPWDQSVDAYAYWTTRDGAFYDWQLGTTAGRVGAYLYSPAFAQVLAPLVWLPWALFAGLWTTLNIGVHRWLAGRWALPLLLFIPISFEIVSGNVHLLYAAAIVIGFRWPAAWALMLLTKGSPGIGLVWFLVRGEWRALGLALGATAAIAGASFLLDPGAWASWIEILRTSSTAPADTPGWFLPIAFPIRLAVAAVIVAFAGRTSRAWLLPVAVTLALPIVWLNSLAILVACLPLWRQRDLVAPLAGPAWPRWRWSPRRESAP